MLFYTVIFIISYFYYSFCIYTGRLLYCVISVLIAIISMEIGSMKAKNIFVRLMMPSPAHTSFFKIPVELTYCPFNIPPNFEQGIFS